MRCNHTQLLEGGSKLEPRQIGRESDSRPRVGDLNGIKLIEGQSLSCKMQLQRSLKTSRLGIIQKSRWDLRGCGHEVGVALPNENAVTVQWSWAVCDNNVSKPASGVSQQERSKRKNQTYIDSRWARYWSRSPSRAGTWFLVLSVMIVDSQTRIQDYPGRHANDQEEILAPFQPAGGFRRRFCPERGSAWCVEDSLRDGQSLARRGSTEVDCCVVRMMMEQLPWNDWQVGRTSFLQPQIRVAPGQPGLATPPLRRECSNSPPRGLDSLGCLSLVSTSNVKSKRFTYPSPRRRAC